MRKGGILAGAALALLVAVTGPAMGQVFDSGSDGSDGAYSPTVSEVFQVTKAVYEFTSINIPAGVTITFEPDLLNNYPVTWLASDSVTVAGVLDLSGRMGHAGDAPFFLPAAGGPGGWQGGVGAKASFGDPDVTLRVTPGLGPGGALSASQNNVPGVGAGHRNAGQVTAGQASMLAGKVYGNSFVVPLQGGSGGAGGSWNTGGGGVAGSGGGGGGGAILIASSDSIDVSGSIVVDGGIGGGGVTNSNGGGGGSAGAIRLVSNHIAVSGDLFARGGAATASFGTNTAGAGSVGRIRLDAYTYELTGAAEPSVSTGPPVLLDLPSIAPRLEIASIAGNAVNDPTGTVSAPDVVMADASPVPVVVNATNIPVGTVVTLRLFAVNGSSAEVAMPGLSGSESSSTTTANATFAAGVTQVVASASFTPTRELKSHGGEAVARVEVTTDSAGRTELAYFTDSGRKLRPGEVKR